MLRKIAILFGAFAFAFGAQATSLGYTYDFTLTIDGTTVGHALSWRSSIYLIDGNDHVVAYFSRYQLPITPSIGPGYETWTYSGDYVQIEGPQATGVELGNKITEEKGGKTYTGYEILGNPQYDVTLNGKTYAVNTFGFTGGSIKNEVKTEGSKTSKTVTYTFSYHTADKVAVSSLADDQMSGEANLRAVLVDWDDKYVQSYYNETSLVKWQNAYGYGESTSGQLSAALTSVPEPTSGLLLLVGMAGLALRRRRAA